MSSITSAPNSPQKSRLEPPRKGRFGGGWTRSLTNLRKEAQRSSSVASPISSGSISSRDTGSASGVRPIPKSSLSTTAIPTPPAVPRTIQSTAAFSPTSNNSAPAKGLRAFFLQFKRSNSTPASVRSEKSTVPASAPASRPDVAVIAGLSSGRSSSAGSKERVAHDEVSTQDEPVVMPPSKVEPDNSAPLEPANVDVSSTPQGDHEGEKKGQEAEEVDPVNIPLPASPEVGEISSFEPALPLEPAASLPPPLPLFDVSSTSVEPLDRTTSKESEGVPSLVLTDKAGEGRDEEEGSEAAVEGEQLVTPINNSETTDVVRVLSTDRIEEEDEEEVEREEKKEDASTANAKPLELIQDVQDPTNSAPTQERSVVDTTSPTDAGSPNSTSSSRGNTSVSPSRVGRERSPVHGGAGQHGQPQQQHQQFRQQYQRQPYHHQQQQQQRPQQYQQQQQHQQYPTSTSSGSQILGRNGSRQIRQSVYGLNKLSIPQSASFSRTSRSPTQKRMSVSPTMHTLGGVVVAAEQISDSDEKRLTEAMFCS
ncbi:hypothetical protein FFLO_01539 [Filobasidium floriforme]|uniref:Uncharacterized protein n=1 Tax=Filobasidium floriforme TaxID=5210 RepID=A0A8K0NS77_9TREE|nr:uncharacterized protein HD553DRAFT_318646 [Filobasidium floriforme]KAG7562981.1 hypothetical protein FFLO_01539 [Filobasidium floriforme]KAH8079284.1 hypothetical protein HD553DRAFT_318646 [Filobasidium floriforme]